VSFLTSGRECEAAGRSSVVDLAVGLLGELEGLAAEHGRPEVRPELSSA
jgi:hypothetical protein